MTREDRRGTTCTAAVVECLGQDNLAATNRLQVASNSVFSPHLSNHGHRKICPAYLFLPGIRTRFSDFTREAATD